MNGDAAAMPGKTRPAARQPDRAPLFARPEFRAVAGETLRPGGLALTRRALALAELPPGALVADLGCGPGATARLLALAGHRVLAMDPDTRAWDAPAPSGVLRIAAGAERLPLPDGCLDAAFCECVLSVTGRSRAVLAETGRVLRPGGVLALSDLCREDGGPFLRGDCLSGALPLDDLREDLRRAGMSIDVFEDHSRLLAELAGRLVFAGLSLRELTGGCSSNTRPGYFLCLARKCAT